ncbi:hypothetical protein ABC347_04705 [Sphingomonas sp. 1P06PA]|uniref:hypothetical protein n=1 Tax=Sphingomonas sp. 1P06PA TaxID=554121 RepID=UPI0039A54B8F
MLDRSTDKLVGPQMKRQPSNPSVRALGLMLLAGSAATAQDLPTTQIEDHGAVVRQDALTRSLLRTPRPGSQSPSPAQRSACAALPRLRIQHGSDHPKLLRLEAHCRDAGL